ncbi:hypothetical protein ACQ4PT_040471 [Festuca glaucescens]
MVRKGTHCSTKINISVLLRRASLRRPARALADEETLQPGWLYFELPLSMLRRSLSGQDMAALAVKASSELTVVAVDGKGPKAARVAPLIEESAERDRSEWSQHTYPKNGAPETVYYGGDETAGKTRNRDGYGSGRPSHRATGVQRLSAILEADVSH